MEEKDSKIQEVVENKLLTEYEESLTTKDPEVKWGGWINEFLWICAGVNRRVLRQCPSDYAKYAGTGGTILFTAIMAALSGGYAISFVFQEAPLFVPIGFALIWGLMIFNLDRFMVNTMYSDGKHTISRPEFWGGLPRIILAIFLGIVISTPIEIRIFQDKIKAQLVIDQSKVGDEIRNANDFLYQQRKDIEDQIATRNNQINDLRAGKNNSISDRVAYKEKELNAAELRLYYEVNGTGATKTRGYGPAAKQLESQVERLQSDLHNLRAEEKQQNKDNVEYIKQRKASLQKEIEEYNRRLKVVENKIDEIDKTGDETQKALTGFSAQINALNKITSPSENLTLFFARLFITLLFISIEVIPTLFKMMLTFGPYDDYLAAESHKVRVLSEKKQSDINDVVNTEVQISTQKNKKKLEAEVQANNLLMEKIAKVQAELLQTAIEKWRKEELRKINENPSAYIQSNTEKA